MIRSVVSMFLCFLLLFVTCLPSVLCQCNTGWVHDSVTNKCFFFGTNTLHQADAEAQCTYYGGHLASVPNAFVNTFISQNANLIIPDSEFWVGGTYGNKSWAWSDGTKFSYYNWAKGQPNMKNSNYNCMSMDDVTNQWFAADCNFLLFYVCETEAQPPVNSNCCDSGWTPFSTDQSCYKVIHWNNWQSAENICKQLNSDLVSIHSAEENSFVAELAQASLPLNQTGQVWIGLKKDPSNQWKWSDGSDFNYSNFALGQKSGSCAMLVADDLIGVQNARLQWLPSDCSLKLRSAVCKYSPFHK